MLRKEFLLAYREEPVAVYADYDGTCLDGLPCCFASSSSSSSIVAVNRFCQLIVGIGVKAVSKLLSLISLI